LTPNTPPPNDNSQTEDISLLDLLLVAAENIRFIVLGPLIVAVFAFAYLTANTQTTFTAKTTLLSTGNASSSSGIAALLTQMGGFGGGMGGFIGGGGGASTADTKTMAYLSSERVANRLVAQFGLQKALGADSPREAAEALRGATLIEVNKKSGLVEVSVTIPNPQLAAQLANGYVAELQSLLKAEDMEQSKTRLETLERMIAEVTNRPHRVEVARQMLKGLLQQYESAKLSSVGAGEGGRVTVVDEASVPNRPDPRGRLKGSLIAALVSLVLILFVVFMRHALVLAGEDEAGSRKLSAARAAFKRAIRLR